MLQMWSINNSQSSARSLRGMLGVVVRQSAEGLPLRFPIFLAEAQPFYPGAPGKGAAGRVAESSSAEPFSGAGMTTEAWIVPGRRNKEGGQWDGQAGGQL